MMRKANVFANGIAAGSFTDLVFGSKYQFKYLVDYSGNPVSLTMPVTPNIYEFNSFPPFFDGLLPEGYQLDGLLKFGKIDRNDYFGQLMAVGDDLVGNITLKEIQS